MERSTLIAWAAVLAVFALVAVSSSDYSDEVKEQNLYCSNVANSVWPDYKNIYNEVCKEEE